MKRILLLLVTLVGAIVIIAGNAPAAKAETISHFQTRVYNCLVNQFASTGTIAYASSVPWGAWWGYDGFLPNSPSGLNGGGNVLSHYGPTTYYYGWGYTVNGSGTINQPYAIHWGSWRSDDFIRVQNCL